MSATVQEHKLRDYFNDIVQEYNTSCPSEPLEQIPSFHVGVSRYPVKEVYLEDEIIQTTLTRRYLFNESRCISTTIEEMNDK